MAKIIDQRKLSCDSEKNNKLISYRINHINIGIEFIL